MTEIQALDAGSWFHPAFSQEKVPALKEVLNRYSTKINLLIELKDPQLYPGIEQQLAETLIQANLHNRNDFSVIVQSFNIKSLKRLHRLLPTIPLALLTNLPPTEKIL